MAPILALALALQAAAAPVFPHPVKAKTLRNGMRVVFVPMDTPGIAAFFTMFRVGSRDETEPGRSGFAHFFEHLAFRGTPRHPGSAWEGITKSAGLDTNAYTDDDLTVYWLSGPSSALPKVIELEADRFQNLAYGEGDFKIEAQAVLGELNKGLGNPVFKMEEALRDLAFTRHTYKHTTIGFERDVRAMPTGYRYAQNFFKRNYQPDTAWVVVAGDFDETAVAHLIDQHFGPWRGKSDPAPVTPEPRQTREREERLNWPTPTLPRILTGYHTPAASDLSATAAQLVAWPLLFGKQSPLYRELVLEKGMVREIGYEFYPHRDPFLFGYLLVLRNRQAEGPARKAVDAAIAAIAAGKADPKAVEDVKAHLRNGLVMDTETPYQAARALVESYYLTGDLSYLDKLMAAVAAVTPADLAAFAKTHLLPANRTTIGLDHQAADRRADTGGPLR
jgi:zinc protease